MKNKCLNCESNIPIYQKGHNIKRKYCDNSCQMHYFYKEYIKKWKLGMVNGMKGKTSISTHIKKYIFNKYKNKCCKCGWNKIHSITGNIPLEINHIDGNHRNNKEHNLELICPNCHSLTIHYKSLNNGNGRENRRVRSSIW